MTELRAIGRVVNPYSNFLEILAIDGAHAPSYDPETDFERACEAKKRGAFPVGDERYGTATASTAEIRRDRDQSAINKRET